jgi:SAM-dependent methyltransferase
MTQSPDSVGQAWAKHFETDAAAYQTPEGLPFLRKFIRGPFIQLPWQYARLDRGSRVLEAGCASGKFSVCFAIQGCAVTALDFSPAMLANTDALRQLVERETGPLDLTLVQGDLENLQLEANQFDLVFNEGVVEHWLDHTERRRVLANMARAVKPGGTLAIIIPNGGHPFASHWIEHDLAFLSAPPMVRYNPDLVQSDLATIGLTDLFVDGIYAWRWIDQSSRNRILQLIGGGLQRLIPLPKSMRLTWGIHLIGMGRKPLA